VSGSAGASDRARGLLLAGIGFFALAAQTLLFRAFLAACEGSELAVGVFFASWLIWLMAGALCGRIPGEVNRILVERFHLLPLLYIPAFVLQQWLLLEARRLAGVASYEAFPFFRMAAVALAANAPVSLVSGLLFPLACRWYAAGSGRHAAEQGLAVADVYILETLGSVAGAVVVTLLLARGAAAETVFLLIAALLALIVPCAGRRGPERLATAALGVALVLSLAGGAGARWADYQRQRMWRRLFPGANCAGGFATAQAQYLYGTYRGQFNIVAWESVCESLPETEHASAVAALALAQQPEARRVLVIGPSSIPICQRLLLLPQIDKITWLNPDPAYPRAALKVIPPELCRGMERVDIPAMDARAYLQAGGPAYDLIILNLPPAVTLELNRFYSREFYQLLKQRLAPGGVVAARFPGGENYLGGELVNLGASVQVTLQSVFAALALKPGDESWFLAAADGQLTEDPAELRDRFSAVPGGENVYPAEGLLTLYPADRIAFQKKCYTAAASATPRSLLLNTDDHPRSSLYALMLMGKQSVVNYSWFELARDFAGTGFWALTGIFALAGVLRYVYRANAAAVGGMVAGLWTLAAPGCVGAYEPLVLVATTGGVGMALGIVLMYHYQALFGSLFLHIGLINALFMLGLALGGIAARRFAAGSTVVVRWLAPITILAQALFMLSLRGLGNAAAVWRMAPFFFMAGLFGGAYVPMAARQLKDAGRDEPAGGALIEIFDNFGGALGAIIAGALLLPVFGAGPTLTLLAVLLAVNLAGYLPVRGGAGTAAASAARRFRPVGYVLFGVALVSLLARLPFNLAGPGSDDALMQASLEAMVPQGTWQKQMFTGPDGESRIAYVAESPANARGLIGFSTMGLAPGVSGYGGSVDLAVLMDADGNLRDFRIIRHNETPAYLALLGAWQKGLRGKNIIHAGSLKSMDGHTGATLSSRAIVRTLQTAGAAIGAGLLNQQAPGGGIGTAAVDAGAWFSLILLVAALVLRRWPRVWWRRGFLLVALLLAGFAFNAQYSIDHVRALLTWRLPTPGLNLPFLLVVGVPLLALFAGNVFCGYLCPFGALQELAGEWRPFFLQTDPDKETWRWGRWVKYVMLFGVVLWCCWGFDARILDIDPLVTVFGGLRDPRVLVLAGALVCMAFFYRRFWCRNLCPAGAFLSLLGRARLLRVFLPRVIPSRCDLGVRNLAEADCLQCDRCRMPREILSDAMAQQAPMKFSHVMANRLMFLGIVAAFALAVCAPLFQSRPAVVSGERGQPAVATPAGGTGQPRNADMTRIEELIRGGHLSGKEAEFYRPLRGR